MKLPIGYDDFGAIIEQGLHFVDKSLFIKELFENPETLVKVIIRPRRFGKTLNLSMLHHFLAEKVYGRATKGMFDSLKISKLDNEMMQHQGKYPVIFLSLKGLRGHSFDSMLKSLSLLIADLYEEHVYLAKSSKLSQREKLIFQEILNETSSKEKLQKSLKYLTKYLSNHHGCKPWVLIDEYDTPIQFSYLHKFYKPMINLMRTFLGEGLKTNPYLEKAVITGILRIAKESLFSELNNITVYSSMQTEYSEHFGFTADEVASLLKQSQLDDQAEAIQNWYNGYQIGDTIIYNPWSIVNCIANQGKLETYWVNTSDNLLIKQVLARSTEIVKVQMETLIQGKVINGIIDKNVVFTDLDKNADALWSLLLFSGYLKVMHCAPQGTKFHCQLTAPNREILTLYQDSVISWFSDKLGLEGYQSLLQSLVAGEVELFAEQLQEVLLESASMFDVKGYEPEKFYHGFVLGLIVSLRNTHIVQSNQESGRGRYDVMLIPKDKQQLGLILEFKTVRQESMALTTAAEQALQQIKINDYQSQLRQQGIKKTLNIGLAFRGKEVVVLAELID